MSLDDFLLGDVIESPLFGDVIGCLNWRTTSLVSVHQLAK
jgi:hypothetical protein